MPSLADRIKGDEAGAAYYAKAGAELIAARLEHPKTWLAKAMEATGRNRATLYRYIQYADDVTKLEERNRKNRERMSRTRVRQKASAAPVTYAKARDRSSRRRLRQKASAAPVTYAKTREAAAPDNCESQTKFFANPGAAPRKKKGRSVAPALPSHFPNVFAAFGFARMVDIGRRERGRIARGGRLH